METVGPKMAGYEPAPPFRERISLKAEYFKQDKRESLRAPKQNVPSGTSSGTTGSRPDFSSFTSPEEQIERDRKTRVGTHAG